MKNKVGFNIGFALLAFTLGLALFQEFDFQTFTFRKKVLSMLYLSVFCVTLFLTFKKKDKSPEP